MKLKKFKKIFIAILIAIILFILFTQNSFAFHEDISKKFVNTGDKGNATNTVAEIIGRTINIIQIVSAGIAIIMLIVIGIRWIYASPEGKAQYAKTSRYYILGVIFIFAAIGLVQIVKMFTTGSIVSQV